jgi:dihydroflavonol-4-reductase
VSGPAFVTGASGFVGGAILRQLVATGRDVRALARSEDAGRRVSEAGGVVARGDLFDEQALLRGMRGCSAVFHVAGVNETCARDRSSMERANIDGAALVVRTAAAAGVSRVVHTSSAATIGEIEGTVGKEGSAHRGSFLSDYERTKFLGERKVLRLGSELGVQVVCVNPSSVQGPGRTEGSARLLLGLMDRHRPPVVDTWLSVVDVDDCADAHLRAELHGRAGSRYIVSAASLTTADAIEVLRTTVGRPRHVLRLPRFTASLAGGLAAAVSRVTGRRLPLCPEVTRTLLHGHRYDASLASHELGVAYRPVEDTVRRTFDWYVAEGLVKG